MSKTQTVCISQIGPSIIIYSKNAMHKHERNSHNVQCLTFQYNFDFENFVIIDVY